MRSEDFGSQSPGRLVPTEGGVDAYVPNPLPPQEEAWSSVATMRALAKAENALGQLVGTARHDLLNPHLVAAPLIRREAIISSRIEGTYTTPRQLALIEAEPEKEGGKGRRIAAEDEAREVLNYVRAVEYGFTRLDTLPMSKRLMRELHEILMKGCAEGASGLASSATDRTTSPRKATRSRRPVSFLLPWRRWSRGWTTWRSTCIGRRPTSRCRC